MYYEVRSTFTAPWLLHKQQANAELPLLASTGLSAGLHANEARPTDGRTTAWKMDRGLTLTEPLGNDAYKMLPASRLILEMATRLQRTGLFSGGQWHRVDAVGERIIPAPRHGLLQPFD